MLERKRSFLITPENDVITYCHNKEVIKEYESKKVGRAPAGVAQLVESCPAKQSIFSLIPSQGTCLGCGPVPS